MRTVTLKIRELSLTAGTMSDDNKSPEPEVVEAVGGSDVPEVKAETSPPASRPTHSYGYGKKEDEEEDRTERTGQKRERSGSGDGESAPKIPASSIGVYGGSGGDEIDPNTQELRGKLFIGGLSWQTTLGECGRMKIKGLVVILTLYFSLSFGDA